MATVHAGVANLHALCEWACTTELSAIPKDVQQRALLVMADDLACAFAGSNDPEAAAWASKAVATAHSNEVGRAAIFGLGSAVAPSVAAATNAVHANWWQLDGGHFEVMCHAGLYCMPAAVAEGQATNRSLGEVLRAFVIGYELTCRLAASIPGRNHLHPHGLWSAAGAFVTLGALRRRSCDELMDGLQLLLESAPCVPFEGMMQGDLSVNILAGAGMLKAFELADGRRRASALEDGSFDLQGEPEVGLGTQWALRNSYHKLIACAGQATAALEAVLIARDRASTISAASVTRITAEMHALAGTMMEKRPTTSLAARFSIPHVLAVAWVYGRTDPRALGSEFLDDNIVVRVRDTVEFAEYAPQAAPPYHRAARVHVHTDAGSSAGECLAPRGSPARPLSVADVRKKIRTLSGYHLASLLNAVERLDDAASLSVPLAALLR